MEFLANTVDGLQMGLCFAVLALGVYISYSILDFPDLSVDGTFPLGGIICTILMLRLGVNPIAATLLTFIFGMIMGAVTGFLHVKLNISKLLSGIITMTGLLSITLALTKLITDNGYTTTIFSYRSKSVKGIFGGSFISGLDNNYKDIAKIVILLLFVIAFKTVIDLFLKTKLGYMLKSTGSNEKLVISLGKNPGVYKIFGLSLANGFVSVSGALYSQLFMSYDNTCGSGKVVIALSAVIIGLAIFQNFKYVKDTTAVAVGAVIYSLCLNYFSLIDKEGIYLKLLNAVCFALILVFNDKIKQLCKKGKS